MSIKKKKRGMLTKFEPQIPWLTFLGFWSGHHGRHCFAIEVLHILRVPLIACPSQPLNNNNAGIETLQNSPRHRNC